MNIEVLLIHSVYIQCILNHLRSPDGIGGGGGGGGGGGPPPAGPAGGGTGGNGADCIFLWTGGCAPTSLYVGIGCDAECVLIVTAGTAEGGGTNTLACGGPGCGDNPGGGGGAGACGGGGILLTPLSSDSG